MSTPPFGFELKQITLSLDSILPSRPFEGPGKHTRRYDTILSSIKEIGLVEPLMVYRRKDAYILVDGHLRYKALKAMGATEAQCIVSTDDEAFTYNARISRLAPIQEHQMIVKAVKNGVSPERIAAALNLSVEDIRARLNLLEGLHPQAVELLKDKPIAPGGLAVLKKVSGVRQIEIAELMVSVNNFTSSYAHALFIGTTQDHLLQPTKPKTAKGLSADEIVRMESEIESLERDFKAAEASHGENMLNLTSLSRYVRKLLSNPKIARFLQTHYADFFEELEAVAKIESLG